MPKNKNSFTCSVCGQKCQWQQQGHYDGYSKEDYELLLNELAQIKG